MPGSDSTVRVSRASCGMDGSVNRFDHKPLLRYARWPLCRKFGSVSTVTPPSRIKVVAVPTKVRLSTVL
jgi:hypothetical protein